MELKVSCSCRIGGFVFFGIFITITKSLYINNYLPSAEEKYCYTKDENPYRHFATKTTYQAIQGDLTKIKPPEDCVAEKFWGLFRHGMRYPSEIDYAAITALDGVLEDIKRNFQDGRGELCFSDYELLETWLWNGNINASQINELTPQGYKDSVDIGARFKQKYPDLFKDYDPDYYYFQHTISNRTKGSFTSFVNGLFGTENITSIDATESNDVIKEYKGCTLWQYAMYTDATIHTNQYEKLIKTPEFLDMCERISKRLGFLERLNDSVIVTMYRACAFEQAWEPDALSKWCTVFDKNDLKLLEYAEDIHILYKSGYGSEYNPKLGCPIVGDLFEKLKSAINTTEKTQKIIAHFTHSTAFHQFITALNLYKDEILPNGENYNAGGDERKWKTALFGASSTNFVGILYRCEKTPEKYHVQFLLDENPFDLTENCTNGLCLWSAFKQKYENTGQSCDLSFCQAIPDF